MRQLTTLDAQFLAVETARTYGHVGSFAVYDPSTAPAGELTVQDVCRLVSERLHLLPPFRWRLVQVPFGIDLPYWVEDPDFDLDFHIRESAVPPPGDDRRLAETVARIFARPLDRNHPLWELYLIQGLPDGQVGLLTKIHHSAVDGVSGNEILSVLLDPTPAGRELPAAGDARDGDRMPGDVEMLGRGLLGVARQPLRALRSVPTTLPNVTELPGATVMPGGPTLSRAVGRLRSAVTRQDASVLESTTQRPPRTPFNGAISPHRRSRSASSRSTRSKRSRTSSASPSTTSWWRCAPGAVREWLLARDALPEEPLVAMVPVSVRTREQRGQYGNRVGMMIVPIPTDEPDPRLRLARTHELLRSARSATRRCPRTC
jgi:WS/DGAT/MGAT family acyltransferase